MTPSTEQAVTRNFASTPLGQIHYAEAGEGDPVLFLHETPRSWDQFRDVLPLVGDSHRAIAMDMVGFGDSCEAPGGEPSIEGYAEGAIALMDALGIDEFTVVGHHTGGIVAIEVGARAGDRLKAVVLSSASLTDEESVEQLEAEGLGVDEADQDADGSHLTTLWQQRRPHYPDDADLLDRYIVDAIKAGPHLRGGHLACSAYDTGPRADVITAPVHVLYGADDFHAVPRQEALIERTKPISRQPIEGGMVPLPDGSPEPFAKAVLAALDGTA